MLDIHRLEIGGAEFEHFWTQQKRATSTRDVSELFERQQTAPGRGRWQARDTCDLAQGERGVIARERTNDLQPLGETTHGFAALCRRGAGRHGQRVYFGMRNGGSDAALAT